VIEVSSGSSDDFEKPVNISKLKSSILEDEKFQKKSTFFDK